MCETQPEDVYAFVMLAWNKSSVLLSVVLLVTYCLKMGRVEDSYPFSPKKNQVLVWCWC